MRSTSTSSCPSVKPLRNTGGACDYLNGWRRRILHQAEPHMRHGAVRVGTPSRTRSIRQAIAFVAQKRTTPYDPLGRIDRYAWLPRVVGLGGALRVGYGRFGSGLLAEVIGSIPIGYPLPGIACHIVKTVAVGRKRFRWQCALGASGFGTDHRKRALLVVPVICHGLAVRHKFVTPHIGGLLQSPASGVLPLRLGRQALAPPCGVR